MLRITRRIMVVGDSIASYLPPYLYALVREVTDEDVYIKFVGSQNAPAPLYCDAYAGATLGAGGTQDLRAGIVGWMNAHPPDVILLHAGVNDINALGLTGAQVRDRLEAFLGEVFTSRPSMQVVVAKIMPVLTTGAYAGIQSRIDDFNALVSALVQTFPPSYQITIADCNSGYERSQASWFNVDGLHPSEIGKEFCARRFFQPAGGNQ